MSISSKTSEKSFDFDKFSLNSDVDEEYDNENIFEESNIHTNFNMFDITDKSEIINIDSVPDKKHKKNIVDTFLNMLDKNYETMKKMDTQNSKYQINILNLEIPKYIVDSRANIPCYNCKNNIEQKISCSFIKVLDKHYFLCYLCKDKFISGINSLIFEKFKEIKKNNNCLMCTKVTEQFQNFNDKITTRKYNLNKFSYFLEKIMPKSEVDVVIMEIVEKSFDNIKHIKPYPNIRIYNFDMKDYRFTNKSRIKSLLKNGFIEKVDDINYKFIKQEYGNHYEFKAEATNKCINCKTDLNLNKFRLVTKYNKQFKNEIYRYENIFYLLYAVCNSCIKYCDNVQENCVKYFVKLYKLKNFDEVVTNEIKNKNISTFLKTYNDTFLQLLENK